VGRPRRLHLPHAARVALGPAQLLLRTLGREPVQGVTAGEAAWASSSRPITQFPDPLPGPRHHEAPGDLHPGDRLPLSFTLYLPRLPARTRLPTLLWAYPLELAEKEVAGQVEARPGASPRSRAPRALPRAPGVRRAATTRPCRSSAPSETVYDTFVEQLVANAKAAIDKAVELGVTDPERVAVAGHSHGALMTANCSPGPTSSGPASRTAAPSTIRCALRLPVREAHVLAGPGHLRQALAGPAGRQIDEPLLLIHGEVDQNPGTVPMQSESSTRRSVASGHRAPRHAAPREPLYSRSSRRSTSSNEMIALLDRHVKNAPPRARN